MYSFISCYLWLDKSPVHRCTDVKWRFTKSFYNVYILSLLSHLQFLNLYLYFPYSLKNMTRTLKRRSHFNKNFLNVLFGLVMFLFFCVMFYFVFRLYRTLGWFTQIHVKRENKKGGRRRETESKIFINTTYKTNIEK